MQNNLAIIGCGSWGSALSIALATNFDIIYLICQNNKAVKNLKYGHPNLAIDFNDNIVVSSDYSKLKQVNSILIATPSYGFNQALKAINPYLKQQQLAWVTKGFANEKFLHQEFLQILPEYKPCVISGPSFAFEVARLKPTALVVASSDSKITKFWVNNIQTQYLRTYISDDIIGVEVGGAVKNILAIAAGMSSGLGFGTNTMSALITRGLAEMTRLGVSLGAKAETFIGLTGLGDLTLTCLDDLSRNRRFGQQIAKNINIKDALKNIGATVEGLNGLDVVLKIAKKQKIEMPICEKVKQIIAGDISANEAVENLMTRNIINEN